MKDDIIIQNQLRSAQAEAIIDSADDAIVSKDVQGIIRSWNKGAERLFGYRAEEIVGRPVMTLIPPERHDEERDILARISRGVRVDHFDTVRVAKDGRRLPVSLTISPLKDNRGTIIGASKIARDISERVQAENATKDTERRKDEFLAMLAHELRNPITPIRTALDIIQRSLGDERRRDWALEVIDRQLVQLTRIIDDLLELGRIVNGKITLKKEMTSVRAVIANAVETTRPLISAQRHMLRVDLPTQEIALYGDSLRLAQALVNLLSNAVKFTGPGGTISVAAVRRDDTVELRIKDSGRGLDQEQLPHVFDLQGDNNLERTEGGLGIGLSVVRRIIELHGGTIQALSEGRGKGSEFRIRLPVSTGEVATSNAATDVVRQSPGEPRRVLIVDDNRDVTDSIAELLRLNGHGVDRHYEGRGVLEKVLGFRADVLVIDLGLPGQNGYDVARELRAHPDLKALPIIAISGYGQPADIERSRSAGINYHLLKPVDAQLLIKLIENSTAAR